MDTIDDMFKEVKKTGIRSIEYTEHFNGAKKSFILKVIDAKFKSKIMQEDTRDNLFKRVMNEFEIGIDQQLKSSTKHKEYTTFECLNPACRQGFSSYFSCKWPDGYDDMPVCPICASHGSVVRT